MATTFKAHGHSSDEGIEHSILQQQRAYGRARSTSAATGGMIVSLLRGLMGALVGLLLLSPPKAGMAALFYTFRRKLYSKWDERAAGIRQWLSTSSLVYYAAFLIPLSVIVGFYTNLYWMGITFIFVGIPTLDLLIGVDNWNPASPEQTLEYMRMTKYSLVLYLYVPVQYFMVFWFSHVVTKYDLTTEQLIPLILGVGTANTIGIVVAHELFHKHAKKEKRLGLALLVTVAYCHFFTEHLYGHHKHVGTPKDPAYAPLGQNFYSYLPRTLLGSVRSAWNTERERLESMGLGTWHHDNRMIHYFFLPILLGLFIGMVWTPYAVLIWALTCAVAIFEIETTNYLEHYGLARKEISPGVYERVTVMHSWDAANRFSNIMLFKLQRHSDHHAYPSRPYQTLRTFEYAPQMPTGYFGMIIITLIPPLWHRIMDHRVEYVLERMERYRKLLAEEANSFEGRKGALDRRVSAM